MFVNATSASFPESKLNEIACNRYSASFVTLRWESDVVPMGFLPTK